MTGCLSWPHLFCIQTFGKDFAMLNPEVDLPLLEPPQWWSALWNNVITYDLSQPDTEPGNRQQPPQKDSDSTSVLSSTEHTDHQHSTYFQPSVHERTHYRSIAVCNTSHFSTSCQAGWLGPPHNNKRSLTSAAPGKAVYIPAHSRICFMDKYPMNCYRKAS